MTGTNRYTHLVGGLPGSSARDAMTIALRYLGSSLPLLPDGENPTEAIPERAGWIEPEVRAVPGIPGLITHNAQARYSRYDDTPWFEAGRQLSADDFDPVVIVQRAFEASWPVFAELRRERELPGLRFQAGVPAPLDLALFTFRQAGLGNDLLGAVTEAKARQVRACNAEAPGDVVFQIETPAGVNMVATSDNPAETAAYVAALLTGLPRSCPGTAWGVHLCDGDWYHQAMTEPASALPLVLLANQIAAQWPAGPDAPVLEYIHLPFAPAGKPPAQDASWYQPLAELSLPPGCRLAAGFVHELLDLESLRGLLGIIEDAYGAEVTIAATCGLGRRPDSAQPADALTKMAALAGA